MNHICLWLKTICCDYRGGNVIFLCRVAAAWLQLVLKVSICWTPLCAPSSLCFQHHGTAPNVCISGWICHFWASNTNILVSFVHKIAFNPHQWEKYQLLGMIIPVIGEAHRKPKKTKFSRNKIFTSSLVFLNCFSVIATKVRFVEF